MTKAFLLVHQSADPYFNMAVDEYLFGRVIADPDLVFLRLYSWSPGGITFGLNQKLERALEFDKAGDTPVIRRITGGRALYHDPDEITYSVTMGLKGADSKTAPIKSIDISHAIAVALVKALAQFGVESKYARNSSISDQQPVKNQTLPCFSSHARHEIVATSGKLVASAQRVLGDSFFQHGSLKPHGIVAHPAIPNLVSKKMEDSDMQHLKISILPQLGETIAHHLGAQLGVEFAPCELSNDDNLSINKLSEIVKKKNLDKREIIKQARPESSLLK